METIYSLRKFMTAPASRVLSQAQHNAWIKGHPTVSLGHILYTFLKQDNSPEFKALYENGLRPNRVAACLDRQCVRSSEPMMRAPMVSEEVEVFIRSLETRFNKTQELATPTILLSQLMGCRSVALDDLFYNHGFDDPKGRMELIAAKLQPAAPDFEI